MESNPVTETLRAIYSLHNRFNEIHHTLTKAPRILALHHQRVDAQQKTVDDASAQVLEQKKLAATKQGQLDDGETKIKKRESQLMECKSNDEYKALQQDIKASKMAMSVLSDEILEVLEKIEVLEANEAKEKETLKKVQAEFEKFKADMEEKRPALEERRAEILAALKEAEKKLPAEFKDLYNRTARNTFARDGQYDVLAPLNNGVCGQCNTAQVKNTISQVYVGEFCVCQSCGRILFAPEGKDF
ncbi:MAG: hypothetical protein IKW80_02845 [Thermoguttaceae bacterium]|nr:hypothetical protein [Thermoguttaceae bacterium]